MENQKFGKLTVLEFSHRKQRKDSKKYREYYRCICECGEETIVEKYNLRKTKSCGCLRKKRGKHCCNWKGCGEISATHLLKIKYRSSRDGIVFDLSIEEAWEKFLEQNGKCALSGVPLEFEKSQYGLWHGEPTASLDRIDSSKGYLKDNIQWVHKDVNKMKQNLDEAKFIEWCHLISNNQ